MKKSILNFATIAIIAGTSFVACGEKKATDAVAPEAAEQVAPEAEQVAPEAGEVAPEAGEVAPEAGEVAPEVKKEEAPAVAPEAKEVK